MNARYYLPLASLVSVCLLGTPALAQPPGGPPQGPRVAAPFSPYLNLSRQSTNSAINYYGVVRPEMQFANAIQDLQRQVAPGPFTNTNTGDQPIVTGHGFGFQNQNIYFLNQNQFSGGSFGNAGGALSGYSTTTSAGRPLPGSTTTMPFGTSPPRR